MPVNNSAPAGVDLQLQDGGVSLSGGQWGKRRLVRTNSISSDYARAAGTALPAKAKNRVLRAVVGFLRAHSGKKKSKSTAITEPASPVSEHLSRTNSASSSHRTAEESVQAVEHHETSRPRVSFDAEVTVRAS